VVRLLQWWGYNGGATVTRTAATQHWNIAWRTCAAHLGRSKRQKSESARSHARGRRWIGSGTNGKPSVRRQLLPGLALSCPPAMLRVTIYATLIMILTMRAASAQNDLRDIRAGKILGAPNKKRKTTEPLIAPTNRQLKGFRKQKKRNLIRGSMSGQLHQRRPSTSNNGYEELDACFVVRDHNGRALLLIGERERPRQPRAAPQAAVCLCSGHG
jgi:hypothetical protein